MPLQSNELNFAGQNIYVGLDVHLKSWTVTILTEKLHHKTFSQPSRVEPLVSYLRRTFPGGNYQSAYEAGFSGFWAHYQLVAMGVNNIIINPADVPCTQKEHLQKTDTVDSRKIARSLRSGELIGIHIPQPATLEIRSLLRSRDAIVRDLSRMKQRIKSFLYLHGISYPPEFERSGTHWSRKFMRWLYEDVHLSTPTGMDALKLLLESVTNQRKLLLEATGKLRQLSLTEQYAPTYNLLRSVPGVGIITAMSLVVEIEDIRRFPNSDKLAGYIGLIPTSHSSGEKESKGEMTFRGQAQIRSKIIESAWTAARIDPALNQAFTKLIQRMEPNDAITRIARKVLNRIFYVWKYSKKYEYAVVK